MSGFDARNRVQGDATEARVKWREALKKWEEALKEARAARVALEEAKAVLDGEALRRLARIQGRAERVSWGIEEGGGDDG